MLSQQLPIDPTLFGQTKNWSERLILESPDRADRRRVLVFRTMPDHLNSNAQIEQSVATAMARVLTDYHVVSVAGTMAVAAILLHRPRFVLGVGGIALELIDFEAIGRAARSVGAKVAYWLHDDPYEFDFGWKLKTCCDWVFNTDRASVDLADIDFTSHLPLAADRDLHIRHITPYGERTTDVFFCGYAYPNRLAIVDRLRDILADCRTDILGEHWNASLPFCRNQRLSADQLIDAYTTSRIVLNIGRQFNIANQRFDIVSSTPGPRTFEAAGAGCVQAIFLESCEIFDHFKNNEEILAFNSVTEMKEIVDMAVSSPDHLEAIAIACQQRVLAEHTYDHRIASLLSCLESNGIWSHI